jgi:Na+-driven multidrug efflux pump
VLCSYVGFEIAKGQNDRARKYLKVFLGLILASNFLELIIFLIHYFTLSHSNNSTLSQFNHLAILTIVFQSWHSMLAGLTRALSFIKEYLFFTFITAALISTLSYDFTFKLDMRSKNENDKFIDGMQLAMIVGYGIGLLLYVLVLCKKEWKMQVGK